MEKGRFAAFLAFLGAAGTACAQDGSAGAERPNILWLTFEDTSSREFGCYGNRDVSTPNADSLASAGIRFVNAWSCGPQSSPARSSLITGCYATSYGMDVHPVAVDTPQDIFFPQLMRDAGYYCTNNSKTHYNSTTPNSVCWDECGKKASYNSASRAEGQPFFSVFNTVVSHMGRIRTFHTDGRRDYTEEGIYPSLLSLPDYVPDLPEVRSDYAGHLEAVQDVDKWLGLFLDDLDEKGLAENTIIFFFSDHGGCLPRGKGYLYESGLDVPMIAYFPPKWRHLAGGRTGCDSSLVGFVDLAPTVLSLAGVRPPEHMQGKALFGAYADASDREYQFAFASNHLHHFTPVRTVSDGRFKLIRSYVPYRQFALRNYYQWGMPSNRAWDALVLGGHNTNPVWAQPFGAHPAEMLFDLENDPGEVRDLSGLQEYAHVLSRLRDTLSGHIRETGDLGFFLPVSRRGRVLYDDVHDGKYDMSRLYCLVETAGLADAGDIQLLEDSVSDSWDEMRYWGAVGYAVLAGKGLMEDAPECLVRLLEDSNPYVAAEAAYAVAYLGKPELGICALVSPEVSPEFRKIYFSALECLSLDPSMRPLIVRYARAELEDAAENLPRSKNEDAGLMARGILVNLGLMDIRDLHGPESYAEGLKLNHGRRRMLPLP